MENEIKLSYLSYVKCCSCYRVFYSGFFTMMGEMFFLFLVPFLTPFLTLLNNLNSNKNQKRKRTSPPYFKKNKNKGGG